jgi:hypothetical protein
MTCTRIAIAGLLSLAVSTAAFAQPASTPPLPMPDQAPPTARPPALLPTPMPDQAPPTRQAPRPGVIPQPFSLQSTTQGFHVVLLIGDLKAGATQDTLPAAARKALDDLKDFLPYKSYRVLDSAWTLSTGNVVNRLRGPEEQEYELNLNTNPAMRTHEGEASRISVRFQLREAGAAEAFTGWVAAGGAESEAAQAAALVSSLTIKEAQANLERVRELAAKNLVNKAEVTAAERKLAEARQADAERRAQRRAPAAFVHSAGRIIDTSFTMDVGETVVVGTSRLKGDQALIVLLSAVPRSSGRSTR